MTLPLLVRLAYSLETELSIELAMLEAMEAPLGPEAEREESAVPTAAVMAGTGFEVPPELTVVVSSRWCLEVTRVMRARRVRRGNVSCILIMNGEGFRIRRPGVYGKR